MDVHAVTLLMGMTFNQEEKIGRGC